MPSFNVKSGQNIWADPRWHRVVWHLVSRPDLTVSTEINVFLVLCVVLVSASAKDAIVLYRWFLRPFLSFLNDSCEG